MTIFNTVLKIIKKNKFNIILYTILLIAFASFNFKTNDTTTFSIEKPDILIVNKDEDVGITNNLIKYLKENTNVLEIDEKQQDDALFYRDVNYIIYIPKNYRVDFLNGKNPEINIKTTNDYSASLSDNILKKYLKVANIYQKTTNDETTIINKINNSLNIKTKVIINEKNDTTSLEKATFYFNFLNYSIIAGCVYVISLVLSSFKEENISKRNIVSSTSTKTLNRKLLLSTSIISIALWIFYIILSTLLIGKTIFSVHGILYMINSFIFSICALTIAFLIGNIIKSKGALNGIINVLALGSSFLCGAFVPIDMLPDNVLKIASIIPSYWYIKNNELIKNITKFNIETIKPFIINICVIIIFSILFIIITNLITKKKQKIA